MLRKETSMTTIVANLRNTITIDDTKVVMIAQPQTAFKLLRVLNHWIDNLIQHHQDTDKVNIQQTWYIKWKAIYPFIRSSKRKFLDVYRMITEDYNSTEDTATLFSLIEYFQTNYPEFEHYYDIKEIDGKEDDKNCFEFTLNLYYSAYNDGNNKFNVLNTSQSSFIPFTSNHSVTTWNTIKSTASSAESVQSNMKIPEVVHTQLDNVEDDEVKKTDSKGISDDSNLSYSPVNKSVTDNTKETQRTNKNMRRTEELKKSVANICKDEIQREMSAIREEFGDFTSQITDKLANTITDQTQQIENLLKPNATTSIKQETHTVPSIYRRSMPSPKPTQYKPTFDFSTQSDSKQDNVQSINSSKHTSFQRSGSFTFQYNDHTYELRDNDFNKHSAKLLIVKDATDLVQFYKQLQSMSVTYNIFLQPFECLTPWNRSPNSIPTTCMFTTLDVNNNTIDAYRRMKSVLYAKLTKSEFHHPEHNAIVHHGSIQQDGFEILYDLMTHCHPKLVSATNKFRSTNHRPDFDKHDSIYSYVAKLQVWLDIEKINHHEFSDDEILNIVMEQLRGDTRYEIALAGINSELTLRDTFQRQYGNSLFPEGLKLNNLPGTVMSYYTEDDRKALFPANGSQSIVNVMRSTDLVEEAIVHSLRGKTKFARESIDKICPGCGKYGHSVFHNGCDFCANFLLASDFFKKYPKTSTKVLDTYKDHQLKRQQHFQQDKTSEKNKGTTKRRPYNTRSGKAKVKMLTDMLTEVLEIDDESSTSTDKFEDAVDNQSTSSTHDEA
jgi:hypothetical protein